MISMEEKIAIVIPAYKCRFLRQTLDSIVVQTCRKGGETMRVKVRSV